MAKASFSHDRSVEDILELIRKQVRSQAKADAISKVHIGAPQGQSLAGAVPSRPAGPAQPPTPLRPAGPGQPTDSSRPANAQVKANGPARTPSHVYGDEPIPPRQDRPMPTRPPAGTACPQSAVPPQRPPAAPRQPACLPVQPATPQQPVWQARPKPQLPPMPEQYRRMHELSQEDPLDPENPSFWRYSTCDLGKLFYDQARFMADFTDDADLARGPESAQFLQLSAYAPTYSSLADPDLRRYFTWRGLVRSGDIGQAVQTGAPRFVQLLAGELLCGVGASSPEDAVGKLLQLGRDFTSLDPRLAVRCDSWARDLCLYRGLDLSLVPAAPYDHVDAARATLLQAQNARLADLGKLPERRQFNPRAITFAYDSPQAADAPVGKDMPSRDELFSALLDCSQKSVRASRFFRDYPEDSRDVACAVFLRLVDHCDKHRKTSFVQGLFGKGTVWPYKRLFEDVMFYSPERHEDAIVWENPVRYLFCSQGRWGLGCVFRLELEPAGLSQIMHSIDYVMRERYSYPALLHDRSLPKYLAKIVGEETDRRLAWREAHTVRKLKIDRSALGDIRRAAASTREALLVDEERGDLEEELAGDAGTLWGAAAAAEREGPTPFAAEEAQVAGDVEPPAETGADGPVSAGGRPAASAASVASNQPTSAFIPAAGGRPAAAASAPAPATSPAAASACAPAGAGASFSPLETAVLRSLLAGTNPGAALADSGATLDLLADAINEKALDLVGDTVLEFNGDALTLVPDYIPDLQDLLA